MTELKHRARVTQSEGEELLGKTIFIADFANKRILPKRVTYSEKAINSEGFYLCDENHIIIPWFLLTEKGAFDKLVEHFEMKIDYAMEELREVQELGVTLLEDEGNRDEMMQEIAHNEGYY